MWSDALSAHPFMMYTLAQQDGGPVLNGVPTPTGGGGAAGGGGGGAGGGPAGGGMEIMWIVIIMLIVIMIWASFRQKREQKKRDSMLGSIRKRDKVQTIGGIIGSVVEIKGDTVILKVDESSNTRMTFARTAIQQILTQSPDREEDHAKSEEEEVKA